MKNQIKLNLPHGPFVVVVVISKFFANFFHHHKFQIQSQLSTGKIQLNAELTS